jgi:hypothetical protein
MAEMLNMHMCLTSRICEGAGCWRNRVLCGHFQNICKLYVHPRILANPFFCIVNLRPEMKSIATNSMQEVVSDSLYDIKKMLESCTQVAS